MDNFVLDREFLAWCLRQSNVSVREFASRRPDFLVISPPKTASTWLADNLRCHPQVFVPAAKEVKYFSYYSQWLDLNWYLDQFREAGGRIKGEASPSYAILPVETIRQIRCLMPDLKLIFLMREPIARSWSHAKHNFRFHEANFVSNTSAFEAVSESTWRDNFVHEWPLASGDYLGQLRRWLSVFPREQIYIDFHESVAHDPHKLLRNVFAFLGVTPDVDLSAFPHAKKIFCGLPGELSPSLRRCLEQLHGDRTRELASFLREQFGLSLPSEWEANLAPAGEVPGEERRTASTEGPPMVFPREIAGQDLAAVLERGESLAPMPVSVLDAYRGYKFAFHRGQFLVLSPEFNLARLREMGPAELRQHRGQGIAFVASSLVAAKDWVDQLVLAGIHAQFDTLRAQLSNLHAELTTLQAHAKAIEPLQTNLQNIICHEKLLQKFFTRPCRFIASTQVRQSFRQLQAFLSSLV
ncbi:MAG: sulfotransferase domain-containing protein [Thermoguttaceae bacterium]|jgi:hypothetical protein